jgi:hypothetical protein
MAAADAQMRQYDQANSLPFAQGTVPLGAGYKNYVGGILEADRTQGVQGALAEVVVGEDNTQEGPYFAEQPTDMYQNPNANNDALAINSYQKPTTPYFANQTPEMYAPPPALTTADANNANNNSTTTTATTSSGGALSSASNGGSGGRNTGNSRGSNLPNMKMSNGEKWIRMGMAGLANSANGPMAQMAAIGGAYTDVQADNRAADAEVFAIEEARRAAEIKARAAGAKGSGSGDVKALEAGQQINRVKMALSALKSGALTGVWDAGVKGWADKYGMTDAFNEFTGLGEAGVGARRAFMRNILQGIKVDEALGYAANTKGAISDKEMSLFLSPLPNQYQDEGVWIEMLEEKLRILQKIQSFSGGNGGSAGGNQETDRTAEDLLAQYS